MNTNISNIFSIDERFKFMENYIRLVLDKQATSLIISGDSGLGKSWRVLNIIKTYENLEFFVVKGFATARALYDTLYYNRNKVVIFDDCDSILEDKVAINILKGALDSYDDRIISWLAKSNDKSIPNQFNFQGQVIFISNLPLENLDKAMKSRALTIDVFMTDDEKIDQMVELIGNPNFAPNVPLYDKRLVLNELLPYLGNVDVNFRTLEKAIKVFTISDKDLRTVKYIGETA